MRKKCDLYIEQNPSELLVTADARFRVARIGGGVDVGFKKEKEMAVQGSTSLGERCSQ